jgi:DNA-binding transcriptional ArsR family regulator
MGYWTGEQLQARAGVLKAMAHPARLRVLEVLAQRDHCVREMQALVGSDMSTVSKHLSVLKNAGLIADEKQGTNVYYHLLVPHILSSLDSVETVLKKRAQKHQAGAGKTGV